MPPRLQLARGERLLASDVTSDGSAIAATTHRLVVSADDGLTSIGWANIERATFDQESGQLVVVETADLAARPHRHLLRVDAPTVLDVIREQVKASVVLTRHVALSNGTSVRVTARRLPESGAMAWTVGVDAGLDVSDPEIRGRIDSAIAAVRAELV